MKNLYLVIALCLSADCRAEVYKCTDATGHTNYQSSPCTEEHKAVQMNTRSGTSVDLDALEKQKNAQLELQNQQSQQAIAEQQAKVDAEIQRRKDAKNQSELTQNLIKQSPLQFSAFAIPAYDPDKLPPPIKAFESRLPDIERFRRIAAQKALNSGECQRVEADELTAKSKLDQLVFLINCSSGKSFTFNETELTQP